jgi:hypothetical protein
MFQHLQWPCECSLSVFRKKRGLMLRELVWVLTINVAANMVLVVEWLVLSSPHHPLSVLTTAAVLYSVLLMLLEYSYNSE